MKKNHITQSIVSLLGLSLLLTSCSYNQYGAVATGSSLGGMFGSSIGGLMGGARGADKGTVMGMVIGGAIGAATTAPRNHNNRTDKKTKDRRNTNNVPYEEDIYAHESDNVRPSNNQAQDIQFDTYHNPIYQSPMAAHNDLAALEVDNVRFLDENNNHRLDYNEKACIVFDITNRGSKTLYNVAPNISCNSKRVAISAAASVAAIMPGQGIRYKATVVAVRKIKNQPITFTISFGNGSQTVIAKTLNI